MSTAARLGAMLLTLGGIASPHVILLGAGAHAILHGHSHHADDHHRSQPVKSALHGHDHGAGVPDHDHPVMLAAPSQIPSRPSPPIVIAALCHVDPAGSSSPATPGSTFMVTAGMDRPPGHPAVLRI